MNAPTTGSSATITPTADGFVVEVEGQKPQTFKRYGAAYDLLALAGDGWICLRAAALKGQIEYWKKRPVPI